MERDSDLGAANIESAEPAGSPVARFGEADVQRLLAEAGRTWDVLQNDLEDRHLRSRS
jgi:hypothetical protein